MLRTLSKRLIQAATVTERLPWVVASRTAATTSGALVSNEPPKPPEDLPAEIFEWDYLINNADSEEDKKSIQQLRNFYSEIELLNRKEFKLTVDWDEFEGKVPPKILEQYKAVYAKAEQEYKDGKYDWHFDEEEWTAKKEEMMKAVNEIVETSKTRITELEAEIEKTEGKLARLETATLEEEMALDPELAKRVDDAVSEELGYTPPAK